MAINQQNSIFKVCIGFQKMSFITPIFCRFVTFCNFLDFSQKFKG